jgi:hypothetical protein
MSQIQSAANESVQKVYRSCQEANLSQATHEKRPLGRFFVSYRMGLLVICEITTLPSRILPI